MRTRRSQRSPTPPEDSESSEEAPEEVPHIIAQVESKKRRHDERAAETASKSAKKARNASRAAAVQFRKLESDYPESEEPSMEAAAVSPSPVEGGTPHGTPGRPYTSGRPLPAKDSIPLGTVGTPARPFTSTVALPEPSNAVAAATSAETSAEGGPETDGAADIAADEDDDDRLPDAVVQELLERQRSAAAVDAAKAKAAELPAVVPAGDSKLVAAKGKKVAGERICGPVTVKALSAQPLLPPSERAAAFLKCQLSGPRQHRSKAMLLSASQEEAVRRYAPRQTGCNTNKGKNTLSKNKPLPAWK